MGSASVFRDLFGSIVLVLVPKNWCKQGPLVRLLISRKTRLEFEWKFWKIVKQSKIKFDLILYLSGCRCSRRLERYSPTVQYFVQNLLRSFNLKFLESIQRISAKPNSECLRLFTLTYQMHRMKLTSRRVIFSK